LADNGLVLNVGVGDGLADRQHVQNFSSHSALFKGLRGDGRTSNADVLDQFLDNLDGFGFVHFKLVDLGANLDPLDGDASSSGFLLDNVLSNKRFGYQTPSGDNSGQLFKICGDDLWTSTLADLSFILGFVLSGNSTARFYKHI